jgi:signal transduction histidine kinase
MPDKPLHFDVSTGLKRVLGRELITDDEVAIFEMVKNSFDAGAKIVHLYFDEDSIVVADDGSGMTLDDLKNKWLFVAYSAKRDRDASDFRDLVASRTYVAGSKGIGRFSSDRLGKKIALQTRAKAGTSTKIQKIEVDWHLFEVDDKKHFETIPVSHSEARDFKTPQAMERFAQNLKHGTIIEITGLRHKWTRDDLQDLKSALAKLINPFGSGTDKFSINITAPAEKEADNKIRARLKEQNLEPSGRDVVNGKVGNFIFSDLQGKTTFLTVVLTESKLESQLVDRGELIYKIREPNPYPLLEGSDFRCEMYYLNNSAKLTFARRVGLPSVQFGSVFLFRNGFRVFPVGEEHDDWFGFNRRKQQGYNRFLGSREVIGRVDVYGATGQFEEASSRNQGLIETPAVEELKKCVMDHCLKRLERYVVPVSWPDSADAKSEDISLLLTDPGRARVSAAVAHLVDNDEIQLVAYSKKLVSLLNERSENFESIDVAENRFNELRKSESEARKIADKERAVAQTATARAVRAEQRAEEATSEADIERRRAHFLDEVTKVDVKQLLNLQHQVTIYSVDINQQIENLLVETEGAKTVPRERLVQALDQIAFQNRRIQAISRFAALANFALDSGHIQADLPAFFADYILKIAQISGSARMRIEVQNNHPGLSMRFNPMDAAIVVDNLISNSKRARATRIKFDIDPFEKNGVKITVTDNGKGLAQGVDPKRVFDMGYTSTHGSGLGLYHVAQVLSGLNGNIEIATEAPDRGFQLVIKITKLGKVQ